MTLWAPLKKGDLVDIVAPGWMCKAESLPPAVDFFRSWGLRVRVPDHLIEPWSFYSNTDKNRALFLSQALKAKDSKAVWCLRGGSGSQRILPLVFKGPAPKVSKMLVGFSDMTSVHAALGSIWKWPSIHGPMFERLGQNDLPEDIVEQVRSLVFGEISEISYPEIEPLNAAAQKKRKIEGVLRGGNLITFQNLIGTRYFPNLKGSILFFEDVGERGYRIDRVWSQFEQAGVFKEVKAIVLGQFTGGEEPGTANSRVQEAIVSLSQMISTPVFSGLEVGHGFLQRPVVCGQMGVIEKNHLRISLQWRKK